MQRCLSAIPGSAQRLTARKEYFMCICACQKMEGPTLDPPYIPRALYSEPNLTRPLPFPSGLQWAAYRTMCDELSATYHLSCPFHKCSLEDCTSECMCTPWSLFTSPPCAACASLFPHVKSHAQVAQSKGLVNKLPEVCAIFLSNAHSFLPTRFPASTRQLLSATFSA